MHAGDSVLDPVNVQPALGQLDLLPLQVADLRGPQAVPVGDQHHGRIAMAVAAMLSGAVHQPLDLALGEVAPLDCQVYDVWRAFLGLRFHRAKTSLLVVEWPSYSFFCTVIKGELGKCIGTAMRDGGVGGGASRVTSVRGGPQGGLFGFTRDRLAELALASKLPGVYPESEFVAAGGLASYGPSLPDLFRRAASYVDKILKGAKPGDLPIEQPTKFELAINLETAQALSLAVSREFQLRADEVIE